MRKLSLLIALVLIMAAALPAAAQEDGANIRVAHLSADASLVDVYINGEAALSGVDFGDVSAWGGVPAGDYSIAVAPANTSIDEAVIGPVDVTVEAGEWYTIAAIGLVGDSSLTAQVIVEDYSPITFGETRLTIFHAIPNADPVSVLANETLLVAGLAYPGSVGESDGVSVVDVTQGTYDLSVQLTEGEQTEIFNVPDQLLTANRNYFIAAVGLAASPELIFVSTNPATLDDTMAEEEEMAMGDTAQIRVGHFAEDAPAVDVYIDGELSGFAGVGYPALSEWVEVPAGTYSIAVAPAGTSIDDAVLGPIDVTVDAGEWYTVAAIGLVSNSSLTAQIIVEDYSPIPEGETRFTVFHAVPGAPPVDVLVNDEVFVSTLAYPGTLGDNDGAVAFTVIDGTYEVKVTANGDAETVLLDLGSIEMDAGNHYFIAAINTVDDINSFLDSRPGN